MKNKEKAQAIATQRALLLAPLLSDDLDNNDVKDVIQKLLRCKSLEVITI